MHLTTMHDTVPIPVHIIANLCGAYELLAVL